MSLPEIRLRLVVRRHAVPEVKLVWNCAAPANFTIAKLLAQVNEVLPLESGQWGLEDYAVELADDSGGAYECLHFQEVRDVLREDDQVVIRSLLNEDLKRRRLSGRHQISSDGKHLVDGIAFGRPWLRAPQDRPAIELPPRKRARIAYDQDADNEDAEDDGREQRLLEAPQPLDGDDPSSVGLEAVFDDADWDGIEESPGEDDDYDSEEDGDFQAGDGDDDGGDEGSSPSSEDDIDEELRLLKEDSGMARNGMIQSSSLSGWGDSISFDFSNGPIDLPSLDHITMLRVAFPLTPIKTIEKELLQCGKNLRKTYNGLTVLSSPVMSFDEMMERGFMAPADLLSELNAQAAEPESPPRPLIQEIESVEVPSLSGVTKTSQSTGEAADLDSDETSSSGTSSDSSEDDDGDSGSDLDDDDSSMSADDGANQALTSAPEEKRNPVGGRLTDDSSDEDDSDSESSDNGAVAAEVHKKLNAPFENMSDGSSDTSSSSDSDWGTNVVSLTKPKQAPSKAPSHALEQQEPGRLVRIQDQPVSAAPGQGLTKTQKRNARRKELKRLRQADATGEKVLELPEAPEVDTLSSELLARKQALLRSMDEEEPAPLPDNPEVVVDGDEHDASAKGPKAVEDTPHDTPSTTNDSPRRRLRVDLGAGRRMLFGALGLKNPKTKDDEEKIKQGLMKGVKPLENARLANPDAEPADANAQDPPEDEGPDSWRDKITYTAVECCRDGVVLSEPPFPFVQRWDPQQQYASMRKRKRSSLGFQDESYYEDSSMWQDAEPEVDEGAGRKKAKKFGKGGGADAESRAEAVDDDAIFLDYDDPPTKKGSSQFTDLDDLPSLPADVTILPALGLGDVKQGMVVTWQDLKCSKATRWQPQLASLTGLVLSVDGDATLQVLLAKRDREHSERVYDEHTGQRLYDKFDAPDSADEDDDADDGNRMVKWADMMDPRIVQSEPSPSLNHSPWKDHVENAAAEAEETLLQAIKQEEANAGGLATSSIAGLDTQQVKAGVEADLNVPAADNQGSGESCSIQSRQRVPIMDLTMLDDYSSSDSPTSDSEEESLVGFGQGAESDRLNSPSRQLQETSQAAQLERESGSTRGSPKAHPEEGGSKPGHLAVIINGSNSSSPAGKKAVRSPSVNGSKRGASRSGSVASGSGRTDEEEMIPERMLPAQPATPPATGPSGGSGGSASSSSFPSAGEIFRTAATSRTTRSPLKLSQQSATGKLDRKHGREAEYERVKQKLEDGEESEPEPEPTSADKNKSIRSLFPNATQPSASAGHDDEGESEEEAPRGKRVRRKRTRGKRAKGTIPFEIPAGTQVISLSPDASPPPTENYADDSIDESYEDTGSLRRGAGWVKKKGPAGEGVRGGQGRSRSRRLSAPADGAARRQKK